MICSLLFIVSLLNIREGGGDIVLDKDSYAEFIEYIRSVIVLYENDNKDKYEDINKDITVLENRMNDENLYLGVVGSFSSGKSTFINSVIHKNLLPTDAVQGTTVATSILKRADFDDLQITYLDGTSQFFSQCASKLLKKYQMQGSITDRAEIIKFTLWTKLINWIKSLFEVDNTEKMEDSFANERINLFRKIIATEELAKDVQYVTLYYRNNNIPYNIAMVDTPGTESLNKRHNDVTKNAIDNICDAVVVIIPYDEPVSEDLLNYVNIHLDQQKKDCIFVVTKIELLEDKEELPRLIRVIKKRLENGLDINNACVIPMPTLIYLKSVDSEMQTTFLDNIPELERTELIEMYEEGIDIINDILCTKRTKIINNKIINICERVGEKLSTNLSDVVNDYEKRNRQLKSKVVIALDSYEKNALADVKKIGNMYQQWVGGEIGFVNISLSNFQSEIKKKIDHSNNSQELCSCLDMDLSTVFCDINLEVHNLLKNVNDRFNLMLHDLVQRFNTEYKQCGIYVKEKNIIINLDMFYEEKFIRECESMVKDSTNSIKYAIRNDTSGFVKKVRAFFSNPFSKHKELAWTELSAAVDALSKKIIDYTIIHMKRKLSEANMGAEKCIQNMINDNREVIDDYIQSTKQSINSNKKNKESTQAHLKRLNEYIALIKEEK